MNLIDQDSNCSLLALFIQQVAQIMTPTGGCAHSFYNAKIRKQYSWSNVYRFSWLLGARVCTQQGTSTRHESPETAADASRWPMVDFKDVLCIGFELRHNAAKTALTYWETVQLKRTPVKKNFNQISEHCTRAMRFKRTSTIQVPHSSDQTLLRLSVWCCQACARTILLRYSSLNTDLLQTTFLYV